MNEMSTIELIAFLSSITSLILAVVAIFAAKSSEREVRNNFEKTQKVMSEYQDKTKEVLAEIDKRAAVIEKTVSESQRQLMETMTNIINETVIPKKVNMKEQFGMQMMQQMMSDPNQSGQMMEMLKPYMQAKAQQIKSE